MLIRWRIDEAMAPRSKRQKGRGQAVMAADDLDDDRSASEELAGVDDDDDEPATVAAPPGAKARWGALPAFVLAPCLLVMFVVSIMGFEMMRNQWGYRQPANKPTSTITRGIASIFMSENELPIGSVEKPRIRHNWLHGIGLSVMFVAAAFSSGSSWCWTVRL